MKNFSNAPHGWDMLVPAAWWRKDDASGKGEQLKVVVDLEKQTFTAGPLTGRAWCKVRNELNGDRKLSEVAVKSTRENGEDGVPYMPRTFPKGRWHITYVNEVAPADTYLWPYFIGTDATQKVEEWNTTWDGRYESKSGRVVDDFGYGIHFSSSATTLGCIRVERKDDLEALVELLRPALKSGPVELEVI